MIREAIDAPQPPMVELEIRDQDLTHVRPELCTCMQMMKITATFSWQIFRRFAAHLCDIFHMFTQRIEMLHYQISILKSFS